MPTTAIKGILHNGKVKPLEEVPYKDDREVVILFLGKIKSTSSDKIWDSAVSEDFLEGYTEQDKAYDKL
ncbi:hypothetical protein KJ693_04600 [bacterium]|nr:hypothetical protein [bacterium]MBU1614575.1 hypothetical protein [bacterium]